LAVHIANSSTPPSEAQVGQLVTAIFEHTCHYIRNNDLDEQVAQRLPHLTRRPSDILKSLHDFLQQMQEAQMAQAQSPTT
jgi:hypothetical protein